MQPSATSFILLSENVLFSQPLYRISFQACGDNRVIWQLETDGYDTQ